MFVSFGWPLIWFLGGPFDPDSNLEMIFLICKDAFDVFIHSTNNLFSIHFWSFLKFSSNLQFHLQIRLERARFVFLVSLFCPRYSSRAQWAFIFLVPVCFQTLGSSTSWWFIESILAQAASNWTFIGLSKGALDVIMFINLEFFEFIIPQWN